MIELLFPPRCRWLGEAADDFRVGSQALSATRFAVFGAGNSAYGDEWFNATAREVDRHLGALGGQRLLPARLGDEDTGAAGHRDLVIVRSCLKKNWYLVFTAVP